MVCNSETLSYGHPFVEYRGRHKNKNLRKFICVLCTINLNIMYCYSHIFTKINEESCLFMAIELDCSEYDIITLLLRKGADIDEKRKVILSLLCVPSLI